MALMGSVNLTHAQRAVPCDVCEDDVPGEYYCCECKRTLCSQCEQNHKRVAATKNHNIVLRAQVGDVGITTLTSADNGEAASCHCEKCNIPAYIKCVAWNHQRHSMIDLYEMLEKEKELLQDDINKMKNDILPKLKIQRKEIRKHNEKYEKKIKQIGKAMEDEHQARLADLTRIHNDRIKYLHVFRDESFAIFDGYSKEFLTKIHSCEDRISKSEEALRKNNLTYITNLTQRKLPGKESTLNLPDPPIFVRENLHSIENILGKVSPPLKLTSPTILSQFKCPLQGSPSICITKEGDVWLGGNKSRELVMVDIKGHVLRRRTIQNRPTALAVMDNGDVIISLRDKDSVILLKDGREQHVYDTAPSCSDGVSATADQKILICTYDGRVVRINSDGSNVKQIYKNPGINTAVHAVENVDGNIYISDYTHRAVVMISKDGKVLSKIKHTTGGQQLEKPVGLVVDKMDNILSADIDNNCVYIIDQDQQMRELLGPSHGIQYPQWLAVDNDNNLWITQDDRTVQVVKYLSA